MLLLCEQLFFEQEGLLCTSLSPTYGQGDLFAAAKLFKNYSRKSFQSPLVKYATLALCLKEQHKKGGYFHGMGYEDCGKFGKKRNTFKN